MSPYHLSGSSCRVTPDDAGPRLPIGGRRPGRTARRAGTASLIITLLVAAAVFAALLGACGRSSGGSSSPSSDAQAAAPTPVPSPQITSGVPPAAAVEVVRRYWRLYGSGRFDAAFALTTGDHMDNGSEQPRVVKSARYVRPVGPVESAPGDDATVSFASRVSIVPTASGSPFGTRPAAWTMWSRVVRMSDGGWRLVELGPGP